jgi:DNA primase
MDVQRLDSYGYPNVLGMMGAYLSIDQINMLRAFAAVTVVPDGDKPGYEAAAKAAKELSAKGTVARVSQMPFGKDPDDLTISQALDILGPPPETVIDVDGAAAS